MDAVQPAELVSGELVDVVLQQQGLLFRLEIAERGPEGLAERILEPRAQVLGFGVLPADDGVEVRSSRPWRSRLRSFIAERTALIRTHARRSPRPGVGAQGGRSVGLRHQQALQQCSPDFVHESVGALDPADRRHRTGDNGVHEMAQSGLITV